MVMKKFLKSISLATYQLRSKIIISFTLVVVLLILTIIAVINYQLPPLLINEEHEEAESLANYLALISQNSLLTYDYITLQENIDNLVKRGNVLYVVVYNKNHENIAAAGRIKLDNWIKDVRVKTNAKIEHTATQFEDENGKFLDAIDILYPIYIDGSAQKWGTLRLGVSIAQVKENLFRLRHNIYYISIFILLIGVVLGSRFLSRTLYTPIVEIIKGTKETAKGNLDYKITLNSNDELHELANAFNNMSQSLKISHQEIENWGKELEKKVSERTEKLEKSEAALLNILSDFKEANQKLRESEERYRQFFEEDLTGDFITTVDGKFIACNPAYAKIFGFQSVEEVLSKPAISVYKNEESRKTFIDLLTQKKTLENHEIELVHQTGRAVHVIENIIGVFNEKGELKQIRGYLFDNTEYKKLEAQLLQSQKMEAVGTLAGGIAHDFNNVMGIILGALDMIEQKGENKDALRFVEMGKKAVERGAGVAKQLLLFSRSEKGDFKLISLHHIVNEVLNIVRHSFPKNIELEMKSTMKNGIISGDSGQIHQALLNLCVNARDAMPSGGVLSVQLRSGLQEDIVEKFPTAQAKNYVVLNVSDNGSGMTKEVRERIFDPFFTTKERGRGTGLGLSIIYGIINSHNAFIDVQSEVGKGTTFSIYFPTIESFTSISDEVDVENIIGGNEMIMVVEDEEHLLDVVTSTLRSVGYNTITAKDGVEGLKVYKERHREIRLVVSDLGLPKISGEQLFIEMKKVNPNIKTIIATGYIEPGTKSSLLNKGVKNILQKPLKMNELLKSVREILDLK